MKRNTGLTSVIVALVLALVVFGGIYWYSQQNESDYSSTDTEVMNTDSNTALDASATNTNQVSDETGVKNYLNINLGKLSSEPEVLGGKFMVTDLAVTGDKGVVEYEDGHNAYTADFNYTVNNGEVAVSNFKVRK